MKLFLISFLFISVSVFSQDKKCCLKADSLLTAKENKEAVNAYTKTLYANPDCARAYYGRGMAKFYLNDFRGSLQDLSTYVKFKSGSEYGAKDDRGMIFTIQMSYITIGQCYLNLKDQNSACLNFSKAGEFGSKEAYDLIKEKCQ